MSSKWRLATLIAILFGQAIQCAASEPNWTSTSSLAPKFEIVTAGIAGIGHGTVWSSMTYAPGSLLELEGWRYRLVGGAGTFRGDATADPQLIDKVAMDSWTDLLAGYQWRSARSVLQLYGGLTFGTDATWAVGAGFIEGTSTIGAKLETNLWLDFTDGRYLKLDIGLATTAPSATAALQLGALAEGRVSVGPEIRTFRSSDDSGLGGGVFARTRFDTGEFVLSTGLLLDGRTPYLGATYLTRY